MKELTILGGYDKNGLPEPVAALTVKVGEVYSVVGFTGSGKSQLIKDVEQMAQKDTVSKRQILIDGEIPMANWEQATDRKLVAHLSQNMNFVLDMKVEDFLHLHAGCRKVEQPEKKVREVIACTNDLAGEPVKASDLLVNLSGGQSRALMIADVTVISDSPVILIDELENAGIDRRAALQVLAEHQKIAFMVTHDPLLALMGARRIIMAQGAMQQIIDLSEQEIETRVILEEMNNQIFAIQDKIRRGERLYTAKYERRKL